MDDQDWTVVSFGRGKKQPTGGQKTIVPRTNQAGTAYVNKLDTTEVGKTRQLTSESRNELIMKRLALSKNQVQLNQDCRFPVNTIRDIENGRYCPNPGQLNTLNRVLKASLKYTKTV